MDKGYWFPAKRYGWGWGPPVCWQGWAVMAACAVLLGLDFLLFPPASDLFGFLVGLVAINVAALAVIAWKGEPPRWRWGGD